MAVFAASRRSKNGHVLVRLFAYQEIFELKSPAAADRRDQCSQSSSQRLDGARPNGAGLFI